MLLERSGFEIGVGVMKSEEQLVSFGRFCWFFFLSFRLHLTLVFAAQRHHSMQNPM